GISDKVSRLTLPLCSIINMNGCAAFILITFLFVSHQEGLYYSMLGATFWIFMATLAAIGNAAVPMGCYFLTSALLAGMGVSLKTMGLILPLYPFFDMVETALNVWSDSCVTALVDQEAKEEGVFYLPKGNNV
ncbi:MAG: cation:dicarboxylase symporter family transporter, partial [Simkania negevensis]|nr:cation:dicarboxylase symporter family transporter [Simkania negevensis]